MRDFTALVKTQQRLSSLPETSIFTFERIDKQHVFVNGYFRDLAELTRFLSRIVGEHSILDIDSRPVLPPGDR